MSYCSLASLGGLLNQGKRMEIGKLEILFRRTVCWGLVLVITFLFVVPVFMGPGSYKWNPFFSLIVWAGLVFVLFRIAYREWWE